LIVDNKEQLCIFGISQSRNYPVTTNAYQTVHAGNNDIIVTKLNEAGSDLVGSTYIGGSGSDGASNFSAFGFNGSIFRGEIVLDQNDYIYVASMSQSSDFPITAGVIQTGFNNVNSTWGQAQDAVVLKLNPDLSTMVWSTYLGGEGSDQVKGLRIDRNDDVYVVGTTDSNNIPKAPGGLMPDYPGGRSAAFITPQFLRRHSSSVRSLLTYLH